MHAILKRTELLNCLGKLAKYSEQPTSDYPEKHLVRIGFDPSKTLDGLELACANGEFIATKMVNTKVEGFGQPMVVPIKLLQKILAAMKGSSLPDDQVELIWDTERHILDIIGKDVDFTIMIYEPDKFLFYHSLEECSPITGIDPVMVKGLASAIRPVIFAASVDAARPVLNCVYFDDFMATTDGFRIAKVAHGVENLKGLIDLGALKAISSLFGDAEFKLTQTNIGSLVECGNDRLMFFPINGNFPAVNAIIPKEVACWFIINKKELLENLKPAGVIRKLSDYADATRMEFENEYSLMISYAAESIGSAMTRVRPSACVKVDGFTLPFKIAVNDRMLSECVSHIPGENIRIGFNKHNTPVAIRPDENPESMVVVLMPMHLG